MVTPMSESGLPLERAQNLSAMSGTLLDLLRSSGYSEAELYIQRVELCEVKPHRRALIQYVVGDGDASRDVRVLCKVYAEGGRAARVYHSMRLMEKAFSGQLYHGVPRPLGHIAALEMLVYLPAEGQTLDATIVRGYTRPTLEWTAEWLATLHRQRLPLDRRFQMEKELQNLALWAEEVKSKFADQGRSAIEIISVLQELARELDLTDVPVHKDFHYGHVLVGEGVSVIDFDEMLLADPNLDLAHFCAYLYLLAWRKETPTEYPGLEARFLNAYRGATGWQRDRRFAFFFAYTAIKIAKQLCVHSGPAPRPEGATQERQVQLILERGREVLR